MAELDVQLVYSKNISHELKNKFDKYYKVIKQKGVNVINFDTNMDKNISVNEMRNAISFMQQALFTQDYNTLILPREYEKSLWEEVKTFFNRGSDELPIPKLVGSKEADELISFEHEQTQNGIKKSVFKNKEGKIIEIKNYSEPDSDTIKCDTQNAQGETLTYEIFNLSNNSREIGEYKNNILEKIIKNNADGSSVEKTYTSGQNLTQKVIKDKDGMITNVYDYDIDGKEIKSIVRYKIDKNIVEDEKTKNSTKKSIFDLDNNFIKSEEFKQITEDVTMREYKFADGVSARINEDKRNKTKLVKTLYPQGHSKKEEQYYSNNAKGLIITSTLYSDGREEESHFNSSLNEIKEVKRFPSGEQQVFYYINGELKRFLKYEFDGNIRTYNVVNEEFIEVNN